MVRVHADGAVCIGAGNCVLAADTVFDQDDDGIVLVLTEDVPAGQAGQVRQAVAACPSGALSLDQ